MTPAQFIELMEDPAKVDASTLPLLDEITKTFPYCQSAQVLYAVNLHRQNSIHFPAQLKKAALYASDRSVLYRSIYRPAGKPAMNGAGERAAFPIEKTAQETNAYVSPAGADAKPVEPVHMPADLSQFETGILREAVSASIMKDIQKEYEEVMAESPQIPESSPVRAVTATQSEQQSLPPEFRTFTGWLKSVPVGRKQPAETSIAEPESLTQKFIRENPSFVPRQEFFSPENLSRINISAHDSLVSETLAEIYAAQGLTDKAISVYETLIREEPGKQEHYLQRIKQLTTEQK